jgi:hypothetical protein
MEQYGRISDDEYLQIIHDFAQDYRSSLANSPPIFMLKNQVAAMLAGNVQLDVEEGAAVKQGISDGAGRKHNTLSVLKSA